MIILALGMFGAAFIRERSLLGFVGLTFAAPFLWYASHAPGGLWFSPLIGVALAGTAVLLQRGRRSWAAAFLAPFVIIVLILAVARASDSRAARPALAADGAGIGAALLIVVPPLAAFSFLALRFVRSLSAANRPLQPTSGRSLAGRREHA